MGKHNSIINLTEMRCDGVNWIHVSNCSDRLLCAYCELSGYIQGGISCTVQIHFLFVAKGRLPLSTLLKKISCCFDESLHVSLQRCKENFSHSSMLAPFVNISLSFIHLVVRNYVSVGLQLLMGLLFVPQMTDI
jgi:hypothetical protein